MVKCIVPIGEAGSGKSTAAPLLRVEAEKRGLIVKELAFAKPLKSFAAVVFDFDAHALYGPSEARNAIDPRYTRDTLIDDHGGVQTSKSLAFHWGPARIRYNAWKDAFVDLVLPEFNDEQRADALAKLDAWFKSMSELPELSARIVLQTLGTDWGRAVKQDIWLDHFHRSVKDVDGVVDLVIATDGRFLNEAQSGGFPALIDRRALPSAATVIAIIALQQLTELLLCILHFRSKLWDPRRPLTDAVQIALQKLKC